MACQRALGDHQCCPFNHPLHSNPKTVHLHARTGTWGCDHLYSAPQNDLINAHASIRATEHFPNPVSTSHARHCICCCPLICVAKPLSASECCAAPPCPAQYIRGQLCSALPQRVRVLFRCGPLRCCACLPVFVPIRPHSPQSWCGMMRMLQA